MRLRFTAAVVLAVGSSAELAGSSEARSEKYLRACLNGGRYLDPDTGYQFDCDESQLDAEQLERLAAKRESMRPGAHARNLRACQHLAQLPADLGAPAIDQWERDLKRAQGGGRVGSCQWSLLTTPEAEAILKESSAQLRAREARVAQVATDTARERLERAQGDATQLERANEHGRKLDPTRRLEIEEPGKGVEKSSHCKVTYRPSLLTFAGTKTYTPRGSLSLRQNVYAFEDQSGSAVSLPAERTTVEGCGIVASAPPAKDPDTSTSRE